MGRRKGSKNKSLSDLRERLAKDTVIEGRYMKAGTTITDYTPVLEEKWEDEESYSVRDRFINNLETTYKECIEIVRKKNDDYAKDSDPFANFRLSVLAGVPLERGILIRVMDKISRISNLLDKEATVKDESITDSLADSINYLAILKAYIEMKGDEAL